MGGVVRGGGGIVIYNPTKNPIKLEENQCSPNAYGLKPGVNQFIKPFLDKKKKKKNMSILEVLEPLTYDMP